MNNHKTNPAKENEKILDEKQLEQVSGGKNEMSVDKTLDLPKELSDDVQIARFPDHLA